MRLSLLSLGFLVALVPVAAVAVVIDHEDVDAVALLPQPTMDRIGDQVWFFSHASVGSNMCDGLNDLRSADPGRYQLALASVGYNSAELRANNPPAIQPGTVYQCSRGNPGWQQKLDIFANSLNVSGWHGPAIDAVMDKFCYIDPSASATDYVNRMVALEAAYPDTTIVYTTMPLTTATDADNRNRNDYNAAVRLHCVTNNKLLFDIADIEAHDSAGNPSTFDYAGHTYQRLYGGYTTDGGHLNDAANVGRQRVALGWYATAAAVPEPSVPAILSGLALAAACAAWRHTRRTRRCEE